MNTLTNTTPQIDTTRQPRYATGQRVRVRGQRGWYTVGRVARYGGTVWCWEYEMLNPISGTIWQWVLEYHIDGEVAS
jgi:hypothetical protein